MIERLRAIRRQDDVDMTAIESYEPDALVKLSACETSEHATTPLDDWPSCRVESLKLTRERLCRQWRRDAARQGRTAGSEDGSAERSAG